MIIFEFSQGFYLLKIAKNGKLEKVESASNTTTSPGTKTVKGIVTPVWVVEAS